MLDGHLSPREHQPTPRGAKGRMVYSRVSGVQIGSIWTRHDHRSRQALSVCQPRPDLLADRLARAWQPRHWPGADGGAQAFYPGTAWAAHGNYGVEYNLAIPLRNTSSKPVQLELAFESPMKADQAQGGLRFNPEPGKSVMFRGTVEVGGLDGAAASRGPAQFPSGAAGGSAGASPGPVSLAPGPAGSCGCG